MWACFGWLSRWGLSPASDNAITAGRAKFCEAIAVYGSAFVERGDIDSLGIALRTVVERDADVLSAAIRKADGTILTEVGDHSSQWSNSAAGSTVDSRIYVPIYVGKDKWGTVEVRFQAKDNAGLSGYLHSPQLKLVAFVAASCMVLFLIYLRKMLQHLDPSKVVPPPRAFGAGYVDRRLAGCGRSTSGSCWPIRPLRRSSGRSRTRCSAHARQICKWVFEEGIRTGISLDPGDARKPAAASAWCMRLIDRQSQAPHVHRQLLAGAGERRSISRRADQL